MDSLARAREVAEKLRKDGLWFARESDVEEAARRIATSIDEARLEEAKWWYDSWDGEQIHGALKRLSELEALRERGKV